MRNNVVQWLAVVGIVAVVGCSTSNPTQKGAMLGGGVGAAAGAGLGAIIGHQSGHTAEGAGIGAGIGALTGAAAGALVGNAQQNMFCPTCGKVYTRDLAYCPDDGTALRLQGTAAPSQQTQQQPAQTSSPQKP